MNPEEQRPRYSAIGPDSGVKILRFEMYDTLTVGGSGYAYRLDWTGSGYVKSTARYTLYDGLSNCFAIGSQDSGTDGEQVRAYYCFDSRRWEVLGESWMLMRLGQTDAAIAKGASDTVSVFRGPSTDSNVNVTAYNSFANVAITKKVWLNYNGSFGGWHFTAAEC